MKTTVEALQDLYLAKGGSFEDVENITTIPDMIDAITTIESTITNADEVSY